MATFDAAAVLEQTKIVWPSGLDLAATSAAIAPLAPGLFSTTAGTPKMRFSPSATLRAAWSVAEPGPNGTMMRNGPLGKLSARTICARGRDAAAPRIARRVIIGRFSPRHPRDSRARFLPAADMLGCRQCGGRNMSVRAGREFLAIPGPT